MRISIFSSVFTGYLASKLPCHPHYLTWSREHVIPKSVVPNRNVTEDPRNIIPMPKLINNARSNRPYTEQWKDGFLKYSCSKCPHPGFCRASMVLTPLGAHPPDVLKGPIARSVLYSVGKHPKLLEVIDEKVLSIDTAIIWDRHFPMSPAEKQWIDSLG
jgi:endonuclease I